MGMAIQSTRNRILTLGDMGAVEIVQPGAAGDWWDPNSEGLCVREAHQSKGVASFAASLTDLTGNGNDAIDPGGVNTPGWDSVNGWIFDGVRDPNGSYLITTFVPQNDQSQSGLAQFTGYSGTAYYQWETFFGSYATDTRTFYADFIRTSANARFGNGEAVVGTAPSVAAGNIGVAGNQGYLNGIADGAPLPAWNGATSGACFIGAVSVGGAERNNLKANIQAQVFYDCVLTPTQFLAVKTAMAAL